MRPGDAAAFLFFFTLLMLTAVLLIWNLQLRYKRRVLLHQERLAALDKGVDLPVLTDAADKPHAPWSPRQYLLRGLMWLFSGLALTVFLLGIALSTQHQSSLGSRLSEAQYLRRMGATEQQINDVIAGKSDEPNGGPPAALALFGLIPMGVGAAYLVVYRAEQKQTPPAA